MRPLALTLSYDGTAYQGWQEQPERPTITGVLHSSFAEVFGHKIAVVGASRTDAGVHANEQVARFYTDLALDPATLMIAWNRRLPKDITLTALDYAAVGFHPHRNVTQKIYRYTIFTQRPSPFIARFGWWYDRPLDIEKLRESLPLLVGTHDFRSFCTGNDLQDTVRTVDAITALHHDDRIVLEFRGQSFLRYMVRRMAGACITIATKPYLRPIDLQRTLLAKNPEHRLITAPACGLILQKISYDRPIFLSESLVSA